MRTAVLVLSLLAACNSGGKGDPVDDTVPAAEPGEFVAGFARARIPAPLGIGTAGFGPFGAPSSESPFSDIYPGTQAIFGHPEIKVMVLSRGEGFEAVFIRIDAVGMFAQFRTEIVREVSERLGRDMDDAILIGATHTHSGPGRVLNSGAGGGSSFFDIVVDKFFPEFYERFVDQIADTVDAAYADARAARLGTTLGSCSAGHNDRRCDDGETYENPTMPLLAIERDGSVDGVLIAYPVHGTVLGIDQLHLSQDVSGAIESAIEDRFDHAVPAIMFNAWGADMAPSDPAIEMPPHGVRDPSYDRMWRVGSVVADSVDAALGSLEWTSEPDIRLQTRRVPIDRERIGYADDEFEYPWGGVYCTGEGDCDAPVILDDLDTKCVPFFEATPAPRQVDVTRGWIGPYAVLTFPGEPGTRLAEAIMDEIHTADPSVGPVLFLGYTQDYLGYSILEDDWWHGGYEASGALWGPRQGEYLKDRLVEGWKAFQGLGEPGEEVAALEPFPYTVDTRYAPVPAVDPGGVAVDVADVTSDQVVTFAVHGQDPWLGAPLVHVEDATGTVITRPSGMPLDSDDQNFDVRLVVEPPWDQEAASRTFTWTWRFSPRSPLTSGIDLSGGTYHLVAELPQPDGSVATVRSAAFAVTAP